MHERSQARHGEASSPSPWFPDTGSHEALPLQRVVWGAGDVTRARAELDRLGARRAMLITTASLIRDNALAAQLERSVGSALVGRCAPIPAHVPLPSVEAALARFQELQADSLIVFGGGSVIDAAKALTVMLVQRGLPKPHHLALPTTLSGSEFSHFYGVTHRRQQHTFKQSFAERAATPDVVILDPQLTRATPEALWMSSGIKALDHAIEGFLSPGLKPIGDCIALLGIRHMVQALPLTRDADNELERLACQLAAWQCYFAPATVRFGLSHRLGHILGGTYAVPHSLTSCITLAAVLRVLAETGVEQDKLRLLGRALSVERPLDFDSARQGDAMEAAVRLDRLLTDLGLRTRLRDVGIARAELATIGELLATHYPDELERVFRDRRSTAVANFLDTLW